MSLEEFVGLADKPESVFVNIDADKDGKITKKEVLIKQPILLARKASSYQTNQTNFVLTTAIS